MSANFSGFEEFGKKGNFSGNFGSGKAKKVGLIVLALLGMLLVFATFKIVPAGYRAVVFNNVSGGLSARGEGLTVLLPFTQSMTLYDVRQHTYTMSRSANEGQLKGDDSVPALTSDGQQVDLDVSVFYHPDPNRIAELHKQIGVDYEDKVVRPASRSIARTSVAKYPVIDVYGPKRGELQDEILNQLRVLLEKNNLVVESVLVRNVNFSTEFKNAIEQKQVAQQAAERKKYELETEKIEKERKIVAAEGDAEAIRLRGEALSRNPGLIQYEYVQKITPGVQTIITDGRSILSLGDLLNKGKGN